MKPTRHEVWLRTLRASGVHESVIGKLTAAPPQGQDDVEPGELTGEAPAGEIWMYGPLVTSDEVAWLRYWDISAFSSADVKAGLLAAGDEVLVRINSPGGVVSEASTIQMAFREFMDDGGTVNILIEGMAHSAASLVTLGANGLIRMAELAESMIHLPWMLAIGGSKELAAASKRILALEERTLDQYDRRSSVDRAEMRQLLEDETFLTAAEAIRIGLVDEVVEPVANRKDDPKDEPKAQPKALSDPEMLDAAKAAPAPEPQDPMQTVTPPKPDPVRSLAIHALS